MTLDLYLAVENLQRGRDWGGHHQNQLACLRLEHQLWLSKKLILFSGKLNAVLKQALSK